MVRRIRRNGFEIEYDILTIIYNNPGIRKTRIMNTVNLNFDVFSKYLKKLVSEGIIVTENEGYFLSVKGEDRMIKLRSLIEKSKEFKELMEEARKLRKQIREEIKQLSPLESPIQRQETGGGS